MLKSSIQMQKTYRIKENPISLDNKSQVDADFLNKLLNLRGVEEGDKENFLKPDFESGLHDPFLLKDMERSVERILKAIKENEHIMVYSDYDADGLPGAAVIHDFFTKILYPHVSYMRPDRHVEGFGLHAHILDEFLIRNESKLPISLIITIDCGIADIEPVRALNKRVAELGQKLDIIITDHHLPDSTLPEAYAIINPKRSDCEYPEKMLCGSGVIYKVVCALVATMRKEGAVAVDDAADSTNNTDSDNNDADIFGIGYEKWLLDLVGLATLSDMVPLTGENRLLAYYGLIVMRKSRRPGFMALAKTNAIMLRNLTEDDIVFTFSPRINVASRLADAGVAFELLTTDTFDRAMELARELNNINTKRKTMVAQITKQAHASIREKSLSNAHVLVIGNPDWRPPVLGLVATQLVKTYKKPAFVWGRTEDGLYKGSVRSVEGIDIVAIMHKTPDEVFTNRGGHAQSGGFTVSSDFIHEFDMKINEAFDQLYVNLDQKLGNFSEEIVHEVDAQLPLSELQNSTYSNLSKLAPFGIANPKPIFAFTDCTITIARMFGKQKDHLEIIATDDSLDNLKTVKAIQFFYDGANIEKFNNLAALDNKYTLIGHIEKNQFMGASDIRLRLVDLF